MILISIVFFLASILLAFVAPEFWIFNLSLFIIACALFIFKMRRFKGSLKMSKFLSNCITIVLTFAILAISNYIIVKNSKNIDLTKSKIHSLSDKSSKVISSLNEDLKITVFAKRENWKPYLKLLELYSNASERVKIKAIDPIKEPLEASKNGITQENELLIEYQSKKALLSKVNELKLTNKILKLISNKKREVCFTHGHGEFDLENKGNNGISFLKEQFLAGGYQLRKADMMTSTTLSKCNVLVSLGVKKDFIKKELETLKSYLKSGGSYLSTIGPNFTSFKRINYFSYLSSLGIDPVNSVVIDRLASVHRVDATINVIDKYSSHPIVKDFKGRIFMPMSMNLSLKNEWAPLFSTADFPASWAETDLEGLKEGKAVFDGKDIKGSNTLAGVFENRDNFSRAVIFGSEQFVMNAYQGQSTNFNLFFNAMDWLLNEDEILALNRPNLANETLSLSSPAVNTIFYIVIIFVPFIFFALAGFIYMRNRKL